MEVIKTENIDHSCQSWDSHVYNPTMVFRYLGIQVTPDEQGVQAALFDPESLQWQKFAVTEWCPSEQPEFYPIALVRRHINLWPKALRVSLLLPESSSKRTFKIGYDAPQNQIDYLLNFSLTRHFAEPSSLVRIIETVDHYTVPLPEGFVPEQISHIHVKSPGKLPVPGNIATDITPATIALTDAIPEGLAMLHFRYRPNVDLATQGDFYQVTRLPCLVIRPIEIGDRRRLTNSDRLLTWNRQTLIWEPLYHVNLTLEITVHAEKSAVGFQDAQAIAETAISQAESPLYCPPHDLWVPMQPVSAPNYDSDGVLHTMKFRVKLLNLIEGALVRYIDESEDADKIENVDKIT